MRLNEIRSDHKTDTFEVIAIDAKGYDKAVVEYAGRLDKEIVINILQRQLRGCTGEWVLQSDTPSINPNLPGTAVFICKGNVQSHAVNEKDED